MANVLIQGSGGGGQKLSPLTTPATADKVKSGKELYDASGTKITGTFDATLPTLNAPTITVSGNVVNIVDGDNGNFSKTWEIRINNLPYRIIAHDGNYTFTELSDGTYTVKVCARGDGFNDSAFSNVETMTISTSSPIYGVSGLYASAPALTRTDDAVGMSWTMSNNEISSDFDSVFPYNQMTRQTIGDNVFVYVPAIWWRIGYDENNYITDIAVSETEMTAGTGQVTYKSGAFYIGAYKSGVDGNSKMTSVSGVSLQRGMSRATYLSEANAVGTGYSMIDLTHLRILEFLWLIETGTKNSQSVMSGYTNFDGATGATDTLTVASGQLAAKGRMRWRYIEDFVGNGFEMYAGQTGLYVTDDPSKFTIQDGTAFTYSAASSNQTIAALGIVDMTKPLLAPEVKSVNNSSYNTYFCDYCQVQSGDMAYWHGLDSDYTFRGLFNVNSGTASGGQARTSTRLLYIPQ